MAPPGIVFKGGMGKKGLDQRALAWPVQYFSGRFGINTVPNLYSTKAHFSLLAPPYP